MAETFHHTFFLNGPAGRLEAMLWTSPADAIPGAALVCHPHPLFGGTMHNKVVFRAARELHRHGFPVLRFNFRGAGLSQGTHDGGRGEQDDVKAAISYLAEKFPQEPLLVAGFSFGAWVGLRVACADDRVKAIVGLGIPVNSSSLHYLKTCSKPKLFLQGERDPYGFLPAVKTLFSQMPEPKRLVVIPGSGHFFDGKLGEMTAALDVWLAETFPGEPKAR